ncbi:hypothetical protein SAMN05428959_103533 [Duganella sp. CF517]|uniref:hypothetical protein n=1 Tax=Duganella sp. CF517 TaxID=1881038 RepID=UPI0008B94AFF|nr:hypothetical protein [Duganella sp. CF517]SEN87239.1 hypothetical protein SAMN05428959_103533 [Duganella sp. CF517]
MARFAISLLPPLAALLCYANAGAAHGAPAVAWLWDEARLPAWSAPEAAVLQRHILLSGDSALTRPRQRWPAMPATTRVTPVLHVEVSTINPPIDLESRRPMIVRAMLEAAGASTSGWVQLDMEAKPSQRAFHLLHKRYGKKDWASKTPYFY